MFSAIWVGENASFTARDQELRRARRDALLNTLAPRRTLAEQGTQFGSRRHEPPDPRVAIVHGASVALDAFLARLAARLGPRPSVLDAPFPVEFAALATFSVLPHGSLAVRGGTRMEAPLAVGVTAERAPGKGRRDPLASDQAERLRVFHRVLEGPPRASGTGRELVLEAYGAVAVRWVERRDDLAERGEPLLGDGWKLPSSFTTKLRA